MVNPPFYIILQYIYVYISINSFFEYYTNWALTKWSVIQYQIILNIHISVILY